MSHTQLSIVDFGKLLLKSGDLDPVYILLKQTEFTPDQLKRWLIAYWCYYDVGVATYLSEFTGHSFWDKMLEAAKNETSPPIGGRWKRGKERRHARGAQGLRMVSDLSRLYGGNPEQMVDYIVGGAPSYEETSKRIMSHAQFGPWISFKICDMIDRVLGVKIDFTNAAVFMFADPKKAAVMFWRESQGFGENVKPKDENLVIEQVVEYLAAQFTGFKAPPLSDRAVDLQEIETVLCKWKSHRNKHYPPLNDLIEIADSLRPWVEAENATAAMMFSVLRKLQKNGYQNEL